MKRTNENPKQKANVGRKPKNDPAVYRYDIRLNSVDNCRFENLFDLSGYRYRGHFIRDKVLTSKIKVIKTDKNLADYMILLSGFRGQFGGIRNNYNQLLRLLKEKLGEKKALTFLYKLEKATIELVHTNREIEAQIQKLEELWLQK